MRVSDEMRNRGNFSPKYIGDRETGKAFVIFRFNKRVKYKIDKVITYV